MISRTDTDMSFSRLFHALCRTRLTPFAAILGMLFLLPALPLMAASSDWAVNEGGRMRLILLPEGADGLRQGALVIEPSPGWITYWKEPGDVGIPPAIKPAPGASYTVDSIGFPVPKVLMSGDMIDVGYDHAVTLPITLKNAPDTASVTLNAFVGVCQNICIPFQADLTVPPDTGGVSDPAAAALVAAALAQIPPGPSEEFHIVDHKLRPDAKELVVRAVLPEGSTAPKVFVSGPSGHVFVNAEVTAGTSGETILTMPIGKLPKKYKLAGKRWGILIVSADRAMETTLAFD